MHEKMIILVVALVTAAIRFLPFVIFSGKRPVPPFITWLGKVLPYACMGMLVVYALKDINFISGSHGVPELLACVCTVLLYLWKRNSLLSIGGGTVCYMLLVQFLFTA